MNIDLDDINEIDLAIKRLERLASATNFHEMIPSLLVIKKVIDRCIKENSIARNKKDAARTVILKAIKSAGRKGFSRSDLSLVDVSESFLYKKKIVKDLLDENMIYISKKRNRKEWKASVILFYKQIRKNRPAKAGFFWRV